MPTDLLAESMNDEIEFPDLWRYVNFQCRVHHGGIPPGWVRKVITLWKGGVLQIRPGRSPGVLLH